MMCPCRECPYRDAECHGRCEIYRDWRAELLAAKARAKSDKEVRDYEIKNMFFRADGPRDR